MDWTEAPAVRRKPPANGYSPILSPPRHVSTLPDFSCLPVRRIPCGARRSTTLHQLLAILPRIFPASYSDICPWHLAIGVCRRGAPRRWSRIALWHFVKRRHVPGSSLQRTFVHWPVLFFANTTSSHYVFDTPCEIPVHNAIVAARPDSKTIHIQVYYKALNLSLYSDHDIHTPSPARQAWPQRARQGSRIIANSNHNSAIQVLIHIQLWRSRMLNSHIKFVWVVFSKESRDSGFEVKPLHWVMAIYARAAYRAHHDRHYTPSREWHALFPLCHAPSPSDILHIPGHIQTTDQDILGSSTAPCITNQFVPSHHIEDLGYANYCIHRTMPASCFDLPFPTVHGYLRTVTVIHSCLSLPFVCSLAQRQPFTRVSTSTTTIHLRAPGASAQILSA